MKREGETSLPQSSQRNANKNITYNKHNFINHKHCDHYEKKIRRGNVKREKKSEIIYMKALPSTKEKIKKMAEEDSRSMSNFIEKLVDDEWRRRKGE